MIWKKIPMPISRPLIKDLFIYKSLNSGKNALDRYRLMLQFSLNRNRGGMEEACLPYT